MNTNTKFRAEFRHSGTIIRTRFYETAQVAQDMLAKRIGPFHYLGRVAGDTHEPNRGCESAPRNGGLVSIQEQAK